jgi:uncharacterized protein involved in exopolysaccharide biosynthesis
MNTNLAVAAQNGSHLVEVSFTSNDPVLSANVVNQIVQEFIQSQVGLRLQSSQRTVEWPSKQVQNLRIQLQDSEDALQQYARTAALTLARNDNVADDKLKRLQDELAKAQVDKLEKQARYELARSSASDTLGEVLDAPSLREYEIRRTTLRQQLAQLRQLLTPNHYKVKEAQAQLDEVEAAYNRERANVIQRLTNDYRSAVRHEDLLHIAFTAQTSVVSDQDAKTVRYTMLKRDAEANRQVYETMLQKVREMQVASAMHATNVAVVDSA